MSLPNPNTQKPLNILSLDGGGVRGLSSLLILHEFMTALPQETSALPCEVFDLICGTSTGGLIAIMLGRLRMSVEQCIDAYVKFSRDVFGKKKPLAVARKLVGKATYDHTALEEKVEELVKEYSGDAKTMQDPRGNGCCRTFVLAANPDHLAGPPRYFRTYRHNGQVQPHDDCQIWEAARATTAASTLFDPITMGNPPEEFIDGTFGVHNNPSYIAIGEASDIWPERPIGLHLSLGTGAHPVIRLSDDAWYILGRCRKLVTNCDLMHQIVSMHYSMHHFNRQLDPYRRFSVDQGLERVGSDEYKTVGRMTTATRVYVHHADRRRDLEKVVQVLTTRAAEVAAEQAAASLV